MGSDRDVRWDVRFLGDKVECELLVGGAAVSVHLPRSAALDVGEKLVLHVARESIRVWPYRARCDRTPAPSRLLLLGAVLLVAVGMFTLVPILLVVIGSFDWASSPGEPWRWGLDAWASVLNSPRSLSSIAYSVLLTARVPVGVLIGFLIAWCLVRADIPGKAFIEFSLWVAYFLPALPVAVGWILLLDKNYGLVNLGLERLPFIHGPVFNVESIAGIMWVHLTLTTSPSWRFCWRRHCGSSMRRSNSRRTFAVRIPCRPCAGLYCRCSPPRS